MRLVSLIVPATLLAFTSWSGVALAATPVPVVARVQLAESTPSIGDIVITEVARRIMSDYYQQQLVNWQQVEGQYKGKKNKQKHMPPGLAKKGGLPPGIQKKMARGGALPPGLAYRDLPPDLMTQLPPLNAGYRYVIVDDRVLLVQAATNLIMDVLQVAAASL